MHLLDILNSSGAIVILFFFNVRNDIFFQKRVTPYFSLHHSNEKEENHEKNFTAVHEFLVTNLVNQHSKYFIEPKGVAKYYINYLQLLIVSSVLH